MKLIRNKYATKFLGERNPFGIIKSEKINSGHGNMRQQLHNSREFYQIVIRARKIDFFPQETRRRRNGENSTDKKKEEEKKRKTDFLKDKYQNLCNKIVFLCRLASHL